MDGSGSRLLGLSCLGQLWQWVEAYDNINATLFLSVASLLPKGNTTIDIRESVPVALVYCWNTKWIPVLIVLLGIA